VAILLVGYCLRSSRPGLPFPSKLQSSLCTQSALPFLFEAFNSSSQLPVSSLKFSMASVSPLFPVSHSRISFGFTTSPLIDIQNVVKVAFSDQSLGVHKVSSATTHRIVRPPPPASTAPSLGSLPEYSEAWEALFSEGSINPGNKEAPPGGFGFYAHGPPGFLESVNSEAAEEVLMSYEVMFEENWGWCKGGKLPGIYGGVGQSSYGCTGGRQSVRCKCFDLRLMWRENGVGELYAYLPLSDSNSSQLLKVPPKSIQHPDYGFSVGRGSWSFDAGKWYTIAQRVKLNTPGREDGEVEIYINGQPVMYSGGLTFRESRESHVQGLHFQTFFGGHSSDWASPKTQRAWFAHVSGAILQPGLHPKAPGEL